MLDVLGLGPVEEAAYRRLIQVPSATVAQVATALDADAGDVLVALRVLSDMGLVATSTLGADQFVASPPMVALGSLVRERQDDLRRAEAELDALTEQYRGAAAQRNATDIIDVVTGAEAIAQRFGQLQRTATTEVLAMVRTGVAVVSAEENLDEEAAVARGVRFRVLLEQGVLERPGFHRNAAEARARGEEMRVAQTLPVRMVLADRQLGLIPLAPSEGSHEHGALLVHPSGLLDGLAALFDLTWATAHPVFASAGDPASQDGLDPLDVRVLTLMLAGLTDHAVGHQLGLSLRTVQRRVSKLMTAADAATRIQLGAAAQRRGWLVE